MAGCGRVSALAATLRAARGMSHKTDLHALLPGLHGHAGVRIGDDCAAIPDGDGYLLLAMEGFVEDFVKAEPYFAGYCGVMVNASDVYAMGGRPIAVVDALWSDGTTTAGPAMRGLADAARIYGIPVVGGHTNMRAASGQLAVAILGRAKKLITSFDAMPGDMLVAAIDLRGDFRGESPYWDASSGKRPEDVRLALDVLPMLAETGLCRAGKDISMAGIVGTALMLCESSRIGVTISLDAVPRPPSTPLERWLTAFPSYGFLLAVAAADQPAVLAAFAACGISAAAIGVCDDTQRVMLQGPEGTELFWDLRNTPFMGVRPNNA
jgi:AIR synthase-related protein